MTPKTKAERELLRQIIISTADAEYEKKVKEWQILGWDENHHQAIEDAFLIASRADSQLKKLADLDDLDDQPSPFSWLERSE